MANPSLDEVTAQRRRTLLIAGVLSVVVLLIGAGVALAVLARRPASTKPPITPAEETSASPSQPATASSLGATGAVVPTSTSSVATPSTTATSTAGQIVRSGRIAYRLGGKIWVSSEDGTGAKAVFTSASIDYPYALSPDGKTLVAASGPTTYVLVDTASLSPLPITGPIDLPVWSPDSSWLAYTARTSTGGYAIRRINRDGTGAAIVLSGGARPQIAPDGVRVAITQSIDPDSSSALQVYDTSTKVLRAVPNGRGAETFAWAAGGSLYFSKDATGSASGWIGVANSNLTKGSLVASLPVSNPQFSAGQLYPSPDGSKVLFALTGDDGYSRIQVLDASTKKLASLSPLYDETPIGWVLDGSAVLFIRGNADQQEKTSLFRMWPDGTHRTELVKNAGL